MDIYFIRHGQTSGNVAKRHQVEHSRLTPTGRQQVAGVAPQVAALAPTHLLSSSHVRTIETASILGQACDLIPETSLLFTELHRPKYLYGHHHRNWRSLLYYKLWYLGLVGGDMTDARGESYRTFRRRLREAAEHLAGYPPDARIVVVSHAVFINLFLAHLCTSYRPLSPWGAARAFWRVLTSRNATLMHVRYEPGAGKCGWQIVN